jgi:tetratricopeptide (TPR) repeat protein
MPLYRENYQTLSDVRKYADKVARSEPTNSEAHAVAAAAALALEDYDGAFHEITPVLQRNPDHTRGLATRGAVYLHRHNADLAVLDFERAVERSPNGFVAASGRAQARRLQDDHDRTLAAYDHLLSIANVDWQRVEAHLGRAAVLFQLGRGDDAQAALAAARQINPKAADAAARNLR